jgi:hypothetical protein
MADAWVPKHALFDCCSPGNCRRSPERLGMAGNFGTNRFILKKFEFRDQIPRLSGARLSFCE